MNHVKLITFFFLICIGRSSLVCSEKSAGQFENEMQYVFHPLSESENGLFIELNASIPFSRENQLLYYFLEHAMFNETNSLTQLEIFHELNELKISMKIDHHLIFNELQQSVRFSLLDKNLNDLYKLLMLLKQVTFSSTLSDKAIELARLHLLDTMKLTYEEELFLEEITVQQLQKIYIQWFQPSNIVLSISGSFNEEEVLPILIETFGGISKSNLIEIETADRESYSISSSDMEGPLERINEMMERSIDGQTYVIDGKIFMKAPIGLESKTRGHILGAALGTIAFGGAAVVVGALTCGLGLPIAALIGAVSATLVSGSFAIPLVTGKYIDDPYAIAQYRAKALLNGSTYAYRQGGIQYVLTPAERREMFIQEILTPPNGLTSIELLTGLYQLSDPIVTDLFTKEELSVLTSISKNYLLECMVKSNFFSDYVYWSSLQDKFIKFNEMKNSLKVQYVGNPITLPLREFIDEKQLFCAKKIKTIEGEGYFQNWTLEKREKYDQFIKQSIEDAYHEASTLFPESYQLYKEYIANIDELTKMIEHFEKENNYDRMVNLCNTNKKDLDKFYIEKFKELFETFPLSLSNLNDMILRI